MKTAVIYARYSCENQSEQSIEGQIRVCRDYARKNDILIVDTYIDRAMTGRNDNRAAFQKMLKDSTKKQWQYILVYRLDRFSRNKFESVIHKKALRDNGVLILSAMENLTDTPEGRMMETMLEGYNQYYSEELTQKVIRGLKESWRKGNATGGHPIYGYDIIDKKYVVNEYEGKIVKEAFLLYSQGYRARGIIKIFNERGYRRRNGEPFEHRYLYHILHDKKYTGVVERQGQIYTNIFPRIISDDIWEKVNAINEENKIAPSRKKEVFDFILSGKLICGDCKCKMIGYSGTSHTGTVHYYYLCPSHNKKKTPCDMKPVQKKWLEDVVINATMRVFESAKTVQGIAEEIFEIHKKAETDNTALKLLEKKRADAVKAQNNMIKAIEMGIITEATKNRLSELEVEITQINCEIEKEKARVFAFLTPKEIVQFLSKCVFDDTEDIRVRKLIVNTFIREILLYQNEIVINFNFTDNPEHIKFNSDYVLKVEQQISQAKRRTFQSISGSTNCSLVPPNPPAPPRAGRGDLAFTRCPRIQRVSVAERRKLSFHAIRYCSPLFNVGREMAGSAARGASSPQPLDTFFPRRVESPPIGYFIPPRPKTDLPNPHFSAIIITTLF